MAFNPSIFGKSTFGAKLWGYSTAGPIVPYADYLVPILDAIQSRLIFEDVFTDNQISYSFDEIPSSQMLANYQCNLLPAVGFFDEGQVTGIGRWGSGYTDHLHVNVYGRNALDRIYLDTSLLTNSTLGLLTKCQAVFDALQLFLPIGTSGNLLTQEPIRLLYIIEATKYKHSHEWSMISMVFEVKSIFNISSTI